MIRAQAEIKLAQLEYGTLHSPYIQGISSMGVEVTFIRCAKRNGGNIKKGTTWGKLAYRNIFMDMPLSRDKAIDWIALPAKIKEAKIDMLNKKICAICGKQGIDGKNNHWGRLRHQEHDMSICPSCIKDIYLKSHRPWENN